MMSILDQLRLRVELAAKALRNDLLASNQADDVLPVGDITVETTDDGVVVKFVESAETPIDDKPAEKKVGKGSK